MSFNIHDVKMVLELNNEDEVNHHLINGWRLLSVGFESYDNESQKFYVLGNTTMDKKEYDAELTRKHEEFLKNFE